jgi:N-acetylneuraminate synthase
MHDKNIMFVAEISANHLGNLERAKELVRAAIKSGANAVKFQTYTADTMTLNIDRPEFRISDGHELWGGNKLYDLYKLAHTPWEWHEELFEICRVNNVIPFSTPFDSTSVDFLESLDTPMYKIASMETGDLSLIKKVARTGKPIIISTGATHLDEIEDAVQAVRSEGNDQLTLLVCTSSYPANPRDAHLQRLQTLRSKFGVNVGVSDHTLGIGVSIAAVVLGATVIEKHLTLRRKDGGPDGAFSMEPEEFTQLIREANSAALSIGNQNWSIQGSEFESRRLRRSLFLVKDIVAGEVATLENIRAIRPGNGAPPKILGQIIGKKFKSNHSAGTPLSSDFVE